MRINGAENMWRKLVTVLELSGECRISDSPVYALTNQPRFYSWLVSFQHVQVLSLVYYMHFSVPSLHVQVFLSSSTELENILEGYNVKNNVGGRRLFLHGSKSVDRIYIM